VIHLGARGRVAAAVTAGALLWAPAAAQATVVFANGFNGDNGGVPVDNHTPGGFSVISGSVDLLRNGSSGVSCAGGFGQCIDLEGSAGYGTIRLETGHTFAVKAGDKVTLEFDISGNQRSGSPAGTDTFLAGFLFDKLLDLTLTRSGAWTGDLDMPAAANAVSVLGNVLSDTGFQHYVLGFIAPQDFNLRFQFGARAPVVGVPSDGLGPLLDNVKLDITAAPAPAPAPEPATWAMMLLGFGALGAALRRRRAAYA
jgi:hypothetical protein